MSKQAKHPPTCQAIEEPPSQQSNDSKINLIQLQINITDTPINRQLIDDLNFYAIRFLDVVDPSHHVSIKKSLQTIIDLQVRK